MRSSCLQSSLLSSVNESFLLLMISYKIIFLDPIHPSLRLPIFAPSLSINFFYLFPAAQCSAPQPPAQASLLEVRSVMDMLADTDSDPPCFRGRQRRPLAWIACHQFPWQYTGSYQGGREEKRWLVFELSLCRWRRLCGWQRRVTCRGKRQISLHHHPVDTPAHKVIKRVTATQSHTYTDLQRKESVHTSSKRNTWQVWVTAAYTERTQQTQLSDRDAAFHNNAIKSYNNCPQEVSEAIMLSEGWRI